MVLSAEVTSAPAEARPLAVSAAVWRPQASSWRSAPLNSRRRLSKATALACSRPDAVPDQPGPAPPPPVDETPALVEVDAGTPNNPCTSASERRAASTNPSTQPVKPTPPTTTSSTTTPTTAAGAQSATPSNGAAALQPPLVPATAPRWWRTRCGRSGSARVFGFRALPRGPPGLRRPRAACSLRSTNCFHALHLMTAHPRGLLYMESLISKKQFAALRQFPERTTWSNGPAEDEGGATKPTLVPALASVAELRSTTSNTTRTCPPGRASTQKVPTKANYITAPNNARQERAEK